MVCGKRPLRLFQRCLQTAECLLAHNMLDAARVAVGNRFFHAKHLGKIARDQLMPLIDRLCARLSFFCQADRSG